MSKVRGDDRVWATDYGIVGDGSTDNANAFEAMLKSFGGAERVYLPRGRYLVSRPVDWQASNVTIEGCDRNLTAFTGQMCGYPLIAMGVPVPSNHQSDFRPDAFGVLDRSIAPSEGRWHGFDPCGSLFAEMGYHGGCLGGESKKCPGYYDYFNEISTLCIEACITHQGNGCIVGAGTFDNPLPFFFGMEGSWLKIIYQLEGDDRGQLRVCFAMIPDSGTLRVKGVMDLEKGECRIYCNKVELKCEGESHFPPRSRLKHNMGLARLTMGEKPFSNYSKIWAVHISDIDRPSRSNDLETYGMKDEHTLAIFRGDDLTGRFLAFDEGWRWQRRGYAWVMPRNGSNPVENNAFRDLSFLGGAPGLGLSHFLSLSVERSNAIDGTCGIGTLTPYASYPLTLRDMRTAGVDASVSLAWTERVTMDSIDMEKGGCAFARLVGTSERWDGGMLSFNTPIMRNAVYYHGDPFGGGHELANITVDNEANSLADCPIYMENHATLKSSYTIHNFSMGVLDPNKPYLRYFGQAAPDYPPCRIEATMLKSGSIPCSVVIDAQGPGLSGKIDASLLPNAKKNGDTSKIDVTAQ